MKLKSSKKLIHGMGPLVLLWFLFGLLCPAMATSTIFPMAKPHCSDKCGNTTVPYPFGFGARECYRFGLTCNMTHHSKAPILFYGDLEVLDISLDGQMRVLTPITGGCSNKSGHRSYSNFFSLVRYDDTLGTSYIFTFANTQNKLTALGCNTSASITGLNGWEVYSCSTGCKNASNQVNYSCPGMGCCQTPTTGALGRYANITLQSFQNHIGSSSPCSYAFIVEKNWTNPWASSDLSNFTNYIDEAGFKGVPVVLYWAVDNKPCEEAMKDPTTYACRNNSVCGVSKNSLGYICNCSPGYEGNPYLLDGCQDINECVDPLTSPCNWKCTNLPGSFKCSCPPGYDGDGEKDGSGCSPPQKPNKPYPVIQVTVGIGLGSLFLLTGSLLVFYAVQKRKDNKLKLKFFKQNGGLLLKQQLSSHDRTVEVAKIYTTDELKKATKNYAQSQILGRGGYGTVYKGILPDRKIVAIKKSQIVDETQIEQFINEVVILSQINHRNVVKLLGCCLETEVPLLVYEFVRNKTLFHHIHGEGCHSPISWDNRLRIATETSEALAYLHSAASPPIIHRDIKSANILLDDNYMVKVADFGASRLVPLDQTQISTLVQGTLGYLDPEYLQSSQLTEKSDVYSFGVVLVELLTGKKAIYSNGPGRETNLAMHFITSIQNGSIWDLLVDQIKTEGCKEQLQQVLKLARRCLSVKGEERPTMKAVAMELQGLRSYQRHPWVAQFPKEVECLLVEPSHYNHNVSGYNSISNEALMSLDGGR